MMKKRVYWLVLLLFIGKFSIATPDSVGTAKHEGELYILHMVEDDETLYSISKRYGVSIDEIAKANKMDDITIYDGQILKIPEAKPVVKPVVRAKQHTVESGQTLYSIAALYEVESVEKLKEWNDLLSDTIMIGQVLNVSERLAPVTLGEVPTAPDQPITIFEDTPAELTTAENTPPKEEPDTKPPAKLQAVKKIGSAVFIETPSRHKSNNVYALHTTAPIGSMVTVTNMLNKRKIQAKVIGRYEDKGNSVIVKLSANAKELLKAQDNLQMVSVDYVEEVR